MRKNTCVFLAVGMFAWLGYAFFRPAEVRSESAPSANGGTQFQIVVGLKDDQPKKWDGKLEVAGAEIANIYGWRFSQTDRVESSGKFQFQTKIGQLENQLLTETAYGQSDWGDLRAKRLIPEGVVLRLKGSESARVKFESSSGSFEFRTEQVAYGKGLDVLDGNGHVERLPIEQRVSDDGKTDDYPALAIAPDGARWVAWLAYEGGADEVVVSGAGKTYKLTGRGDFHAPALAVDGKGRVWAAWSQNDSGIFRLYASTFESGRWSKPENLTPSGGNNIWPRGSYPTGATTSRWSGRASARPVL